MEDNDFDNLFTSDNVSHKSDISTYGETNYEKPKKTTYNVEKYLAEQKNYDYHKYNFSDKTITTTDEQYKIITHDISTDMLVLACAGSGKSTTMVCRVKYLIDHGVLPEKIILTTFNVDACESLKSKIKSMFGFTPNIVIGTFDSIAKRLYYRYFKNDYFVGINEYTIELVKYLNTEKGKHLPKKFDYIIFDEFQDVNEYQYQVIKKFYDGGVKVILIGDDAQNIYQWRGSDLKYILHATDYFPTIKTFLLSTNYRSSEEIVTFANNIIKNNKDNIVKPMYSKLGKSYTLPIIKYYCKLNYQSQDVVRTVAMILQNENVKPDDIAIIARNNYPLKDIEEEFEKYNIAHKTDIKYISLITYDNCDAKQKVESGYVTLTTIHKSKGLEWKYVFLVSCDDDIMPSNLDPVGIQEERRLFYVAVTRAKTTIRISFTRKTITRFIGELDKNLYIFQNFSKKFFDYSDSRFHDKETDLVKVIGMLKEDDIEQLRKMDIIPKVSPLIDKIHEQHTYSDTIDDKFLHSDFNNFIIRYVIRSIGTYIREKNIKDSEIVMKNMTCFNDEFAKQLVNVVTVSRNIYNVYHKYNDLIESHISSIKITDSNKEIIEKLNDSSIKIDANDINHVITLIRNRLTMMERMGEDAEVCMVPENYLPDDYLSDLTSEYSKYTDVTNETDSVLGVVYKVSLCENICNGRRRLIYQNVYNNFVDGYDVLFDDIKKYFVPKLSYGKMICNRRIRALQILLKGTTHIIDEENKSLIDVKCSNDPECKLEWILQLLGKVAILKYMAQTYKNIPERIIYNDIQFIKIYNPILGTIVSFDIMLWDKYYDLLEYLCNIRKIKYVDPKPLIPEKNEKKIIINKESQYFDDMAIINNLNNEYLKNASEKKTQENTPEKCEISQKHEQYANYLKKMLELYDEYNASTKRVNCLLDRMYKYMREMEIKIETENNKNLIPHYIIFDTETTGLPFGKNPTAETNLSAYNSSRILQLSWACYSADGKLIKVSDYYIKPEGYKVAATEIHGITEEIAQKGKMFIDVMKVFYKDFSKVDCMIAHNVNFDVNILKSEMLRRKLFKLNDAFDKIKKLCTMQTCTNIVNARNAYGKLKSPNQSELYQCVIGKPMENAHNAKYDVLNLGLVVSKLLASEKITI